MAVATAKIFEFPRQLLWQPTESWTATVKGTLLGAKVDKHGDSTYVWVAFNGRAVLGHGMEADLEKAKEAARKLLEGTVQVVRPLAT